MHIGVDMSEFVQKAPFDLILLFEKDTGIVHQRNA